MWTWWGVDPATVGGCRPRWRILLVGLALVLPAAARLATTRPELAAAAALDRTLRPQGCGSKAATVARLVAKIRSGPTACASPYLTRFSCPLRDAGAVRRCVACVCC